MLDSAKLPEETSGSVIAVTGADMPRESREALRARSRTLGLHEFMTLPRWWCALSRFAAAIPSGSRH
jgi:hypothetical protein